jgi:hypothetical protein
LLETSSLIICRIPRIDFPPPGLPVMNSTLI